MKEYQQHFIVFCNGRMVYWTDAGSEPRIEKAFMDGTGRSVIHNTGLSQPTVLALDIPTQTLYWGDSHLRRVESSEVDGSNRRLIVAGVSAPFGIVVDTNRIFFSDAFGSINSINKSDNIATMLRNFDSTCAIRGIQIVDQSRQIICKLHNLY